MPKATLHVVRTDAMLWALGGFEPATGGDRRHSRFLPDRLMSQLRVIAAKPRTKYGEISVIAKRWGRSPGSIRVTLCYLRKEMQIRKGLPIPRKGSRGRAPVYPTVDWRLLDVGDCAEEAAEGREEAEQVRRRLAGAARSAGVKVTTRHLPDEGIVRAWRIE